MRSELIAAHCQPAIMTNARCWLFLKGLLEQFFIFGNFFFHRRVVVERAAAHFTCESCHVYSWVYRCAGGIEFGGTRTQVRQSLPPVFQ